MRYLISIILKNGCSKSIRTLPEYVKYLYILQYIFTVNELGKVCSNNNAFWDAKNNSNRIELIQDVLSIRKANVKDDSYFHIINRFENGDKYGIEI